ncbi:PH domain-containing protein [Staphylococcus simulans]
MTNSPENKLTLKESWSEINYLDTLTKEEKEKYNLLSTTEKRKILEDFKSKPKKAIRFEKEIKQSDDNLSKIYQRFEEIGVSDLFGTKKEVKELPLILKENELIMYVTSGFYDGNTYLIVCTDKRLLFLDKGMIYGLKFHEIPLNKINSVSYKKGLLFGTMLVYHGAASITIQNIDKKSVSIMANVIQEQISKANQPTEDKSTIISAADELLKYKELLDAGILTQEEFDIKKKELL